MGIFRYFLAVLVALSHTYTKIGSYNEGVVAVISFYLISGYVMTLLIEKYYLANIKGFYWDRAIRLLPQFGFYTALAWVLLHFTFLGNQALPYMNYPECTAMPILGSFSLFGNNFRQLFGDCLLLPQSWSLGLEGFFMHSSHSYY